MTIGIVQTKSAEQSPFFPLVSSASLSWDATPTLGNTLYLFASAAPAGFSLKHIVEPSGWDILYHAMHDDQDVLIAKRVSDGTETGVTLTFYDTGPQSVQRTIVSLTEVNGTHEGFVYTDDATGTHTIPNITPTGGVEALMLAFLVYGNAYGIATPPAGYTLEDSVQADDGASELFTLWSRHEASTSGTYGATFTTSGGLDRAVFAQVWLSEFSGPVADFQGTPASGIEPLTVNFEDLSSGGSVTAWDWDFGDGGTSTSQDPTHVYANPGSYTVVLVVTIDGTDYTVTKTAYIQVNADVGYEPPPPGRAILEIKATPPGADRWDVALWDEGRWSATSWQDVTPYGVEVAIAWGSDRPELGILSTPDAATWAISFYDPDRVLDPANPDSPYAHDLQPYLPVRLRHNETVIKQGFLESGSHKFSDGTGYWRVMDIQASLANAVVPEDTTLSDTLFQRARDAISAAGLAITVAPDPPGGDPALAPWVSAANTAWQWISDAAQQVLWMPYVRNDNTLGFRDYRTPFSRSRVIGSPNLEDLQSLTMHNGLFSIVGARELVSEGTDINRRELTPKPRYGAREYLRDDPTPDSGDWAQAVLDDRAVPALRWTPGKVIPFSAAEVHDFATIEAIEQVSVNYPEQDILFDGIVVGGQIHVIGKKDADALWDFGYFIAQIPLQPLTDDDDVSSYLTNDDDATDILYPDV